MGDVVRIGAEGFTSPATGLADIKVRAARHLRGYGWGDGEIATALSCRVQDLARIDGWRTEFAPAGGAHD